MPPTMSQKHLCEGFQERKGKKPTRMEGTQKVGIDTTYPPIGGVCNICGNSYERKDFLVRHIREEHEGKKRKRKPGDRMGVFKILRPCS